MTGGRTRLTIINAEHGPNEFRLPVRKSTLRFRSLNSIYIYIFIVYRRKVMPGPRYAIYDPTTRAYYKKKKALNPFLLLYAVDSFDLSNVS